MTVKNFTAVYPVSDVIELRAREVEKDLIWTMWGAVFHDGSWKFNS
jgi:hypothetical protein